MGSGLINTARQLAFDVLRKIEKDKSYSNIAIAGALKDAGLQNADKALFTAIVYGTIERMITIDYNLSLYLKQPLKKLKPQVLIILRMGAYQVLFMDKIPDRAAINESVNLTKENGVSFASGLVNAVLRKISTNGLKLPEIGNNPSEEEKLAFYSIKYSCPKELVELFINSYGEGNAVGIMEHSLGAQSVSIRVNTTRITADDLAEKLNAEGVSVRPHKSVQNALCLENVGSIEELDAYKEGLFHVQDVSSQMCCAALGAQPGDTVFDVCAAPGGKSFTIAELMENSGVIKSFDLHEHRVKLISDGAKRLGLQIVDAQVGDAEKCNEAIGLADRVLCDVPCAGLGIIGRKPEIRYKSLENIDNLPHMQYNILTNASLYLKVNGTLVYSTCSLNPAENDEVVSKFVNEHPEFSLISTETVMPHLNDSDGFFIAVLIRTE